MSHARRKTTEPRALKARTKNSPGRGRCALAPSSGSLPECYVGEVGYCDSVHMEPGNIHCAHDMFGRWRFRFYRSERLVDWLEEPPSDVIETVLNYLENRGFLSPNKPDEERPAVRAS